MRVGLARYRGCKNIKISILFSDASDADAVSFCEVCALEQPGEKSRLVRLVPYSVRLVRLGLPCTRRCEQLKLEQRR